MKGGYIEDIHPNTPFPHPKTINSDQFNSYRCLHLPQAKIFNYFSHHLITVPPKSWRDACRKTNTLCLGTFITENPHEPAEHIYLSTHTADILIYLARRYRFDGYLINIEREVKDLAALFNFLSYLVNNIHKHIPNSQIIWYDSVSHEKGGKILYQN